jgi:hypothetical protein
MEDDDLSTKYSEANFLQLVTCLEKATEINQRNQLFYVEVLRMLAEFVVYAEKYRKKIAVNYFEKLRERGMFDTLGRLLEKNNRFLNMQMIQTVSIFMYNIKEQAKKSKYISIA